MCRRHAEHDDVTSLKRKSAVATAKPLAELVFVEKGESWGIALLARRNARARFYRSDCVSRACR